MNRMISTHVLTEYNLPDADLLADKDTAYRFLVWQPDHVCIVIGRSNRPETSLYLANVTTDGVPVYQRRTGGQSVVLTPEMLIVSLMQNGPTVMEAKRYFKAYNGRVIAGLAELGVREVEQKGISDITIAGRKIAGTALYRHPHQIFYHAVLNVAGATDLMERYLVFPERVPDYRAGRGHRTFVTSLYEQGYRLHFSELKAAIVKNLIPSPKIE